MKIAGCIMFGLGILIGVLFMLTAINQRDIALGIVGGLTTMYIDICSGLAVIHAADIPEIHENIEKTSLKTEADGRDISKMKEEIVKLENENKELLIRIKKLEEKMDIVNKE